MTEHGIHMVLDTAAIASYMRQEMVVGDTMSRLASGVQFVALPVLCLAEAYRQATGVEALVLDVLSNHPITIITPVTNDDAEMLGGWSRIVGRHDLAHAALDAAEHHATLMTSERETVNRVLAQGWPIIDL
jgi:hypothetical protein